MAMESQIDRLRKQYPEEGEMWPYPELWDDSLDKVLELRQLQQEVAAKEDWRDNLAAELQHNPNWAAHLKAVGYYETVPLGSVVDQPPVDPDIAEFRDQDAHSYCQPSTYDHTNAHRLRTGWDGSVRDWRDSRGSS
jgi:hypothetical protein